MKRIGAHVSQRNVVLVLKMHYYHYCPLSSAARYGQMGELRRRRVVVVESDFNRDGGAGSVGRFAGDSVSGNGRRRRQAVAEALKGPACAQYPGSGRA